LGKYRIDELIGTGGMGNVVRASHLYLHQSVAIKVLLPQMAESDSTKQRFLREAQATVRLKSEHSARVMDVGTVDGVPFMVMEFLDGNDLNQILRHHGPQQPAIVVDLMLQACEGISEAHALGIVHRDIKPSNFFITRRPDGSMLLKILDFGISKTPVGYEELTGTQTVIGTPSYMAPEQMKSGRSADPRSDIWSIGIVMYQLLNGRPPFSGESFAELVLKVGLEAPAPMHVPLPTGLGEVILRCLEKDPNLRHQNVGELARMLAPYATDPVSAAQSAGRAARILQHRGAQLGMQGSPLTAGGGLSTPIPISPAQLTPRSWPPSQGTSLSQGAGQVTLPTRGRRGLLVAGIASLCALAGVGGYAISQASRSASTRDERHVDAPQTAVQPSPAPVETAPAETAPTAHAAGDPLAAAHASDVPALTPPAAARPAAAPPTPAADVPVTWKPSSPMPTIVEPPAGAATATDDDDPGPAAAPKPAPAATKPAPADAKPAPADTARPAVARPAAAKPAVVRTAPAADSQTPATRPQTRPATKPKKSDDLFDSRH
jgi:serine/threonine-protein kinase